MPVRRWTTRIPAYLRRCGGGFPGDAHPGGEIGSRRRLLDQRLCALVAVVAHRRPREQHLRRAGEAGQRPGEQVGALGAAVEDELLACRGPLLVADAGTGQVHDRVDALQPGVIDGAGGRVPADVVGTLGLTAHETHDAMAVGPESREERGADRDREHR